LAAAHAKLKEQEKKPSQKYDPDYPSLFF